MPSWLATRSNLSELQPVLRPSCWQALRSGHGPDIIGPSLDLNYELPVSFNDIGTQIMSLYEINDHLGRAKDNLAGNDPNLIRYACLDLRFCLEIIAYRHLKQYGDVIPGSLTKAWKADQIIKTLASFDPTSDQSGELSFGIPKADGSPPDEWKPIGKTETIEWRKFRKYYNKLGSFLHAPKEKTSSAPETRELQQIITDLERVNGASAIVALKIIRTATCHICAGSVYIGEDEFAEPGFVTCNNTQCNALFNKVINENGEKTLTPVNVLSFQCKCGARIPRPLDSIWRQFNCPDCFTSYRVDLGISVIRPL